MSNRRANAVGGGGAAIIIAPWEHPIVWEFVGKGRYLQAAFCKSAAHLYSAKFGSSTLKSLSNIAAEGGLIELVAWSREIGCRWDGNVFESGVRGGSIPLLKYLWINDCRIHRDASLCRTAGTRGHLEALVFLRERCCCVWNKSFCEAVAEEGRLEILQYARAQPQYGDSDIPGWNSHKVCMIAAKRGHIHILEWAHKTLHEKGFFDEETCQAAASGGKLDALQYLRGVGCAWDESTCLTAVQDGHVSVLEWALENGCPWAVNDIIFFGLTALHYAKNSEVIEFLIDHGADINAIDDGGHTPLCRNVDHDDLETVKILLRLGADVNIAYIDGRTPLDIAILGENLEMIEVLRAAGARQSTRWAHYHHP